ncbi:RidA family protein [Corynebacterium lubricantis]|uniref:RidA family protein n=1 Tax=Corynebacterium lubricantis TaxID=541095 RepID=UPI000361EBD7|nr:RidA family protein [Corynebacterium lubricantis]
MNQKQQAIMPAQLPPGPAERTMYSYGVRAGDFLHISGMVAFDQEANIVGIDDIEAQTDQVFQNLQAVVEEAGGFLENIISTTTYLVDVTDAPVVNIARGRYFTGKVLPTHTVVGVAALARPEFLVEISAVAYLGA